jgi:oligoendopeptidase F
MQPKLPSASRALCALVILFAIFAQAQGAAEPDFSRTPRGEIPAEFTWNVDDLFKDEAAWRAEFESVKQRAETVDALAKTWTASPGAMADLLERVTEIQKRARRVGAYTSLQGDMDLGDSRFQKMSGEVRSYLVRFGAKLSFLAPDVLKLGQEKVEAYLKAEPRLAAYRRQLENILREKDHVLPEAEQRIASLTRLFSDAASKSSEMLNNLDLPRAEITLADGSKVQLGQAAFKRVRASKNVDDRRKAMEAFFGAVKPFENTFAALMDGNIKQHLFTARIHKHPTCLDTALFGNAIDTAVYRNLIAATRANLNPMHRLLQLRQRLLGLPEFRYGDIYASAVASVDRRYPWAEGKRLVVEAVAPLGEEYGLGIGRAFDERWIDIYPNKGKQSGAYSSGVPGVHPYVKMNYDSGYREVATLAHELGHAMHSWLSDKYQPAPLVQYPIFLAEIASTFNENLLMAKLLGTEKDERLKLFLLDSYLEGLRGTLYRQTLFAEFELAMHEVAEKDRTLTPDLLNAKYLELTRAYYGHEAGVVKVEDYIQSEWAVVPHFFMNFYVYQYATGVVASMALADAVQREGAPARERYLTLLKAGGNDYPLETLKKAGVDMTKRETLDRAFKVFNGYVDEMERIAARLETAAGK